MDLIRFDEVYIDVGKAKQHNYAVNSQKRRKFTKYQLQPEES